MPIPPSIADFLSAKPHTVMSHRTAFTAQEEAAVTHVPGRQWAKTVVCLADGQPILAVLPAHYQVDFDRLARLAGATVVRLATEAEIRGLYPACETGAVPPLGPMFGQRMFVDRVMAEDAEIVFHAGTHVDAVKMKYEDLAALCSPLVGDFGTPPPHRSSPQRH
ncbi:MAG TPA: YbaK/EbsC family protein [Vicinamibacterales bacterium]|nr:YbaK/EbsC family protein [Vicinamibacterales bacterium]